jgi:hypothetical protein
VRHVSYIDDPVRLGPPPAASPDELVFHPDCLTAYAGDALVNAPLGVVGSKTRAGRKGHKVKRYGRFRARARTRSHVRVSASSNPSSASAALPFSCVSALQADGEKVVAADLLRPPRELLDVVEGVHEAPAQGVATA